LFFILGYAFCPGSGTRLTTGFNGLSWRSMGFGVPLLERRQEATGDSVDGRAAESATTGQVTGGLHLSDRALHAG
jgi:hypothetical protein